MITEGDYSGETAVRQNDEIGTLAATIDNMAKQLAHAKAESERFDKMRQDFVYSISHELRTPVTVIRGSIEAINDGVIDNPTQREEYMYQIQAESIHMQKLINDLLDLARLQNIDFKIELEPVDLAEVINDVLRGLKSIAVEKGVFLTFHHKNELTVFQGDYGRVRQILVILVENAIKFSVLAEPVIIRASLENGYTIITIENQGETIPESDLPYIFDQYHQVKDKQNKGAGLGLAIAREIAQRLGIHITVTSQNNKTIFRLEFVGEQ